MFESRAEGSFAVFATPVSTMHSGIHAESDSSTTHIDPKRIIRRLSNRARPPPARPARSEAAFERTPLPTRFSSEDDPSPAWLREALYGPSFNDLQAIRAVVDGERRKVAFGGKRTRPVDVGWDFARWETELERKTAYKRRKM